MRDRSRQLHASGTRADQYEGHLPVTFACIVGRFGKLECAEDFRPDELGVIQVFETRRVLGKLVVAEIARAHPGGDNQKVE